MTCKTCGPNVTSGPKPYYEEVKQNVVENHETILQQAIHAVGVRVLDAWNIPQESETVTVRIEEISVIPIGSYLFHPNYGYYLISQWNPKSQQIGVTNDSITGNVAVGTFVPARTPFLVSPKPCCQGGQELLFPFLAEDFKAPFTNQSVTIDVTSSFGLSVGDYIRIGDGVYRLDSIDSTKRIKIFNKGNGYPFNTIVKAKDSQGTYQHLITVENSFVCTVSENTSQGKIVVCDTGEQKLITGASAGQVATLMDPVTGLVQFQSVGISALLDGSVTTPKLADAAVTIAKMADNSVGAAQIIDATVGNAELAANAVATPNIFDAAVTNPKLADGSVTQVKMAVDSVGSDQLLNDSITTVKILDGAVTNPKIGALAVDAGKLAVDSVLTAKILNLAVTTAKLADANVTLAKMANNSIINQNIVDGTINGYTKIAPHTIRGANILDTSIAEIKLGGLPSAGAGATLPIDDTTNMGIYTNTATTWIWGPWVIVRFDFDITFIGAKTDIDYGMPIAPYNTEGDQVWFGVTEIISAPSTLQNTAVHPVTGGVARIHVDLRPGTVVTTNHIQARSWLIYPWRGPDLTAEG